MKKVILFTALSLALTTTARADSPASERIAELERMVQALQHRMDKAEKITTRLAVNAGNAAVAADGLKNVVLDLASKEFSAIHTSMGILLLTIHSVSPYADGVEVQLEVGNTTNANLSFTELFVRYGTRGPEYDTASDSADVWLRKVDVWSNSLLTQSSTLTDTLSAGRWTRVKILLPAIRPEQFGYLEVQLNPRQASLKAK